MSGQRIEVSDRPRVRVLSAARIGTPPKVHGGISFAVGDHRHHVGGRSHGHKPYDHDLLPASAASPVNSPRAIDRSSSPHIFVCRTPLQNPVGQTLPSTRSPARRTIQSRNASPTFVGSTKVQPPQGRRHFDASDHLFDEPASAANLPAVPDSPRCLRAVEGKPADNMAVGESLPRAGSERPACDGSRGLRVGMAPFQHPVFEKRPYVAHRRQMVTGNATMALDWVPPVEVPKAEARRAIYSSAARSVRGYDIITGQPL